VKIFCSQEGTNGYGKQDRSQQNDSSHSILPANICNHLVPSGELVGSQFSISSEVEPLLKSNLENAWRDKIDGRPNQFQLLQQKREEIVEKQKTKQTSQLNHDKGLNLVQPE